MWYENIQNFINNNAWLKITIDAYLVFIVITFIIFLIAYSKKTFFLIVSLLLIFAINFVAHFLDLGLSSKLYDFISFAALIFTIVVLAPDFRNIINYKQDLKEKFMSSSEKTKTEIADAVMYLSSKKIGAIITIEGHNSLDQYAERAIQLNAEVSKELLINIFIPNTPLHDGAVIVRGNKIRCAGAYYVLTQHNELDKTTGSRHRAGLGISEVTDSLTIICSEETGKISIATEGFMIPITDRDKLMEYLEMFVDKK